MDEQLPTLNTLEARMWLKRDPYGLCSVCCRHATDVAAVEANKTHYLAFCRRCVDRLARVFRIADGET